MDLELKDKVAIVGGASKGLGRACADILAEEGVKVALCSRTQADLEQAAQEIRDATDTDVLTFAGDLDHYDTITPVVPHWRGLITPRKSSGRLPYSAPCCSLHVCPERPFPI